MQEIHQMRNHHHPVVDDVFFSMRLFKTYIPPFFNFLVQTAIVLKPPTSTTGIVPVGQRLCNTGYVAPTIRWCKSRWEGCKQLIV